WCSSVCCSCFFFQAEDGIRGFHVTGVQTCALPICLSGRHAGAVVIDHHGHAIGAGLDRDVDAALCATVADGVVQQVVQRDGQQRSEERRVGQECGGRGSPDEQEGRQDA